MDTDLHLWFFNNLSALLKGECVWKIIRWWARWVSSPHPPVFQTGATDLISYSPIYKTQKEKIVGLEPTTDCLTDNYSTKWVKFFLKRKDCCVRLYYGCGGLDSNQRPSGYEPDELPTAPPRVVPQDGLEPSVFRVWTGRFCQLSYWGILKGSFSSCPGTQSADWTILRSEFHRYNHKQSPPYLGYGTLYGIWTRDFAVKGRWLRPLVEQSKLTRRFVCFIKH